MSTGDYHVAELNIARVSAPLDDPIMKEFVDNLETINALAEQSPGFAWRLKDDASGNATTLAVFDDPEIIVNLSVWETIEHLKDYVYRSQHAAFLKRRKDWFSLMRKPYLVLWWVKADHQPPVEEARARLQHLHTHGNTPFAFNISGDFSAQDAKGYIQTGP